MQAKYNDIRKRLWEHMDAANGKGYWKNGYGSALEADIIRFVESEVKNCLIADVGGSLPSDEDIQREAYIRVECWDKVNDGDEVDGGYDGFIKGCKWIIGKLRQ